MAEDTLEEVENGHWVQVRCNSKLSVRVAVKIENAFAVLIQVPACLRKRPVARGMCLVNNELQDLCRQSDKVRSGIHREARR